MKTQTAFFKKLIFGIILTASVTVSATDCFQLWGPSVPQFDSICFDPSGKMQLFKGEELKLQTQVDVKFIPSYTTHRPGLSDGIIIHVPDSYQYSSHKEEIHMYLEVTVPVQRRQEIHTQYGVLDYGNLNYIIGQ